MKIDGFKFGCHTMVHLFSGGSLPVIRDMSIDSVKMRVSIAYN